MKAASAEVDTFEDHCWKDVIGPETLTVYKPYRRGVRIGERPAVLAIDLYRCVFPDRPLPVIEAVAQDPRSCGEYAWAARAGILEVLAVGRRLNWPVIFTTREVRPEVAPAEVRSTRRPAGGNPGRDYVICEEFGPRPGELVIYKERASAFFGTPLIAHLQRLRVDTLVVCGETTSGCVRASVVDGYSHGFHVVVAEEAVFDRSLLSHKINLFDMHHKYADVMHISEIAERVKTVYGV